jgi:hypothetical protein
MTSSGGARGYAPVCTGIPCDPVYIASIYTYLYKKKKKKLVCDSSRARGSAAPWAKAGRESAIIRPTRARSRRPMQLGNGITPSRATPWIGLTWRQRASVQLRGSALPYAGANTSAPQYGSITFTPSAVGCRLRPVVSHPRCALWPHRHLGEFGIRNSTGEIQSLFFGFKKFMCTLIANCLALNL